MDRYTQNASLFNLVERVNVPPEHLGRAPAIPLEVHAYWRISASEAERELQIRWVMKAETGLETPSPTFKHRAKGQKFKLRSSGLPLPPVAGDYTLCVDWRYDDDDEWQRQAVSWPLVIAETEQTPRVTH